MTFTRTGIDLADGRRLYYYDTEPGHHRDAHADTRDLPPRAPGGEMRFDALRGEWVSISAARQHRPFLPPSDECPLCPSRPGAATEIPAPGYQVAVFQNRFPSFAGEEHAAPAADVPPGPGIVAPATGRTEVVCFTDDHGSRFADLSPERTRLVVDALADRTAELSRTPGVAQVFCFENRGEEIGVTLHHPHGQIYGYPYVTPVTRAMLAQSARYRREHGDSADLFEDLLRAERDGGRVVAADSHWTAFVPHAARWPFEVHFHPHIAAPDLPSLPPEYRAAFGPIYLDVLRRFDALFDGPMPYVSAWHQAPAGHTGAPFRVHLQLFSVRRAAGKLKYLAGSESAMGGFVNDVPPEVAAELLNGVTPRA
ncbi:UDPglucose--hexose-1-phosphate uridylyltransferase [Stackebrandtia albiflava]|uniref:Galactose-1-phosphate uridylyltransferase n=1 Tax=Stackebrandtia albiflava TaxID=406432 RepID=A0A562V332_9ACTN|nr:galactose-1-phosphate uridylyltransferase [Stackebrandtia albiflava]TWJ12265.1 UDPglucose--hexose-1-phosphate uridylyltransferase [Stackebrandtia albiflava]